MTEQQINEKLTNDDLIGNFIKENCPKCGTTLLGNKRGDKWCSNAGGYGMSACSYGLKEQLTEQQIIETLATRVMGWEKAQYTWTKQWYWKNSTPITEAEILVDNWNPLQNIADAWMLVERLNSVYYFEIFRIALSVSESGQEPFVAYFGAECAIAETAQKAISMAAYQLVA